MAEDEHIENRSVVLLFQMVNITICTGILVVLNFEDLVEYICLLGSCIICKLFLCIFVDGN